MENTKKALIVCGILASLSLSACANTVHGAGHDVENAGQAVERTVPAKP